MGAAYSSFNRPNQCLLTEYSIRIWIKMKNTTQQLVQLISVENSIQLFTPTTVLNARSENSSPVSDFQSTKR